MRKVLIPILGVLSLAFAGTTWADAMHGQCNGTGSGTCSDNGTNTPLGDSTTFGFTISPGSQTGDLIIDFLVPNNDAIPASFTVDFANNVMAGTATLLNPNGWVSGSLAKYVGIDASPHNPIGAFLPATQRLDPGATGFFVFQLDLGLQTIHGNSGAGAAGGTFLIPGGFGSDLGGYILAFCGKGCKNPDVGTANSGGLLVNGTTLVITPEPASLTLLLAGLLGLALLRERRVLLV